MYLGLLFLLALILFKVAFYKENFIVLIRNVLSLFWLFALPGYFMMLYWSESLEFVERIIIGIILSAGAIGVFSYYIGLMGLDIKYHAVLLPLFIIAAGLAASIHKKAATT